MPSRHHIARGATVICSDQHMLDDTAIQLKERYRNQPPVKVICNESGGNWVSNVNLLIEATTMSLFRIIPHDDTVDSSASEFLAETLRSTPDAVLCHGYVRAEDIDGIRLPLRDEPNFPLRPLSAPDMFSMGHFWQGLFNGSFKALMRREPTPKGMLLIRPTKDLIHSERAWLHALSLLGELVFDERASMRKRYWSGSLTDAWNPDNSHYKSAVGVMISYVDDIISNEEQKRRLHFNLYFNLL